MSDPNGTNTPEETPDDDLAGLRRAAKDGKEAKAKAEQLERENAFLKAGIPLGDTTKAQLVQMFVNAYDGELETEAIRTTAVAIGLIQIEEPPPANPEPTPAELAEAGLRGALGNGVPAGAVQPSLGDAKTKALANFRAATAAGKPEEIARQEYVAELIHAGATGNDSAWFNQRAWDQEAELYGNGPR